MSRDAVGRNDQEGKGDASDKSRIMPKIVPVDMSNRGLKDWVKFPVLPHLVTHLYLNNNQLSQLPPDFFLQFTNLQWLDLRNNQLRDLPRKVPKEQHR